MKAITVKELIEFLQTQQQDLQVAYSCCSEQVLLELDLIRVEKFCPPRADGWIQNNRPDYPTQDYLLFPGN